YPDPGSRQAGWGRDGTRAASGRGAPPEEVFGQAHVERRLELSLYRRVWISRGVGVRIDVAELEIGQVLRATFEETVDSRTGDVTFDAPVTGEVEAGRTSGTLYLRGRLTTTAPMVCGRCLGGFRQTLAISVDEEFQIGGAPTGGRGALGPEDFVVPLGPDLVLDVTEVARQHLLLALPMVPVCRPECRALWKLRGATLVNCPKCHSPMRAHRVCPTCGTYAGRDVMKIEAAEEK